MLAASSRRLTKAVTSNKRAPKIVQTRACASKPLFVPPSLKLATYSPKETAEIQAWLDKINADPVKQGHLNVIVNAAKKKRENALKFWQIFAPIYGVKVPEKGVQREVLAGVIRSTTESWSEYQYALRVYQAKLQQDEEFYNLHADLHSKDASVAKKARATVLAFIKAIQTKSDLAKQGVFHLIRTRHWESIRNGIAAEYAKEYINRFKREVNVEITTAQPLSASEMEHYESRFRQIANDERTKVFITNKEDPSILGGQIININGKIYDESWKTQQEKTIEAIARFNSL